MERWNGGTDLRSLATEAVLEAMRLFHWWLPEMERWNSTGMLLDAK